MYIYQEPGSSSAQSTHPVHHVTTEYLYRPYSQMRNFISHGNQCLCRLLTRLALVFKHVLLPTHLGVLIQMCQIKYAQLGYSFEAVSRYIDFVTKPLGTPTLKEALRSSVRPSTYFYVFLISILNQQGCGKMKINKNANCFSQIV